MKQRFIKKEGNSTLLLFFAGWGSDENLFPDRCRRNATACCVSTIRIWILTIVCWRVTGRYGSWPGPWGMGSLPDIGRKRISLWDEAGSERYAFSYSRYKGIPEAIFQGTLENFSEPVLIRFRRRICGSAAQVKTFLSHHPYREVDDLHQELAALWTVVKNRPAVEWTWDKAVVGTNDKIFRLRTSAKPGREWPWKKWMRNTMTRSCSVSC